MDGRKFCVRSGAAIATFITIAGLELTGTGTASAATAAPLTGDNVAVARAKADRLSHEAAAAGVRHDRVQAALDRAVAKMHSLDRRITHERRTSTALKSAVAQLAGTSAISASPVPGSNAAPAAQQVTPGSSTLLTNVVVVSQDTGGLAQRMNASDQSLATLTRGRAALAQQVRTLTVREHSLAESASSLQQQADAAASHVTDLIGGPAVAYALSKVGNGYVFGASGPTVFDCSGLTMAAWATAGVSLPHNAAAQYAAGHHISESELRPGDLVFYYSPISHVGMYIGNGKIVNALNPGVGVVISGLHDLPYSGAVRPG